MVVEGGNADFPYSSFSGSVSEWKEWNYRPTHTLTEECKTEIVQTKGVTNPPLFYSTVVYYLTLSGFYDDVTVVIPLEYLSTGISAGIQRRKLIGVIELD